MRGHVWPGSEAKQAAYHADFAHNTTGCASTGATAAQHTRARTASHVASTNDRRRNRGDEELEAHLRMAMMATEAEQAARQQASIAEAEAAAQAAADAARRQVRCLLLP